MSLWTQPILLMDEAASEKAARALAPRLRPGDCLALEGDLGAGKSFFARALLRALAEDPNLEAPSPTFTLVQTYDLKAGEVWHYDWYRLTDAEELPELGWPDPASQGIALVEWPDRFPEALPPDALWLRLAMAGESGRILTLSGPNKWAERLQGWMEQA